MLLANFTSMTSSSRSSEHFFGEVDSIHISNIRLPSHRFRIQNDDEDIKKMANSIRRHGLLQPIVVRPKED